MSEPFVGEIRMFAGNYAPYQWALCDGQILSIMQNTALFSLLGTQYGGDGRELFALPDMRGRAPMHQGQGRWLSMRRIGEQGGAETHQLSVAQLPAHRHTLQAASAASNTDAPANALPATSATSTYATSEPPDTLSDQSLSRTPATSVAHNNMQPYLCVNFIICLYGVYPSRW